MKLRSEVVKLCAEKILIRPFIARCTPTSAPANPERSTARIEKEVTDNRSHTESNTAATVMKAAARRFFEISFFAPPDSPIRSTNNEIAVCPAIDATE